MTPPKLRLIRSLLFITALAAFGLIAFWFSRERTHSNPAARKDSDLYAGSASCRGCHAAAFQAWTSSHHALAERDVSLTEDRKFFDSPSIPGTNHFIQPHLGQSGLELIETIPGRPRQNFSLARVIGVDPLRQFLVQSTNGRWQATELAVDPKHNDWFDVFGDENRQPGEWGHWSGRGMNWNSMCAACHNTALRKSYSAATDAYSTTQIEHGVGCEACHGPMAQHVKSESTRAAHGPRDKSSNHSASAPRFDKDQILWTCGSCHARRSEITGKFRPGESFSDHYTLSIPDETDLFYPDGQVRDEDYEFTAFLGSRMHAAGVRCIDCHEPHSGKTRAPGNALCLRCHGGQLPAAPRIDPAAHSHHALDQPGGLCVNCHMPQTSYMQRHARHDHGFTIPDPWLTQQDAIPNACNRCHRDQTVAWALTAVERWHGPRMARPTRLRAHALAAGRAGRPEAKEALLKIAREEKIGLWRAAAIRLLRNFAGQSDALDVILDRVNDLDPVVRAATATVLEAWREDKSGEKVDAALEQLSRDSRRAVRIAAAWSLRARLAPGSPAAIELRDFLDFNSDQPIGQWQIGIYYFDRGDLAQAQVHFERAISWDANSPPFHESLATVFSAQGKSNEALTEMEKVCRLAPKDAELRFKLALAWNEIGKPLETIEALEKAVALDPQHSRAWYNLGLAKSAAGQDQDALQALARAEQIDLGSARIPYARATILLRLGRLEEAKRAAARALELDRNFSPAAELLNSLPPQN